MSDWQIEGLSFDKWVNDLETVIAAADPQEPFTLLGISQGAAACIAYAARYPERVSRLLLYGAYARGWARRGDAAGEREYGAITDLVRAGWGRDNPVFRQVFTSRFIPGASSEQMEWFNELCLKTTTPENAATILAMRAHIDVTGLLGLVTVPTLVIHSRNDVIVPIAEGRFLASAIPGAEFVELDSANHILLESEPAWTRFCEAVLDLMGAETPSGAGHPVFQSLSPREREILALISDGLANAEIAGRLAISEKTVRNHVSNLFDKLGVWSRAQAIVFARDHGFTP
jgi:pimeloyl-ACP methyl ester carboxylesterase/DNA-binding CsgD family transcriptional regulator